MQTIACIILGLLSVAGATFMFSLCCNLNPRSQRDKRLRLHMGMITLALYAIGAWLLSVASRGWL